MTKVWIALPLAVLLSACCTSGGNNAAETQRKWCHDRGGYIANTGWYEWKCVINNVPVFMPSPQDGPQ